MWTRRGSGRQVLVLDPRVLIRDRETQSRTSSTVERALSLSEDLRLSALSLGAEVTLKSLSLCRRHLVERGAEVSREQPTVQLRPGPRPGGSALIKLWSSVSGSEQHQEETAALRQHSVLEGGAVEEPQSPGPDLRTVDVSSSTEPESNQRQAAGFRV